MSFDRLLEIMETLRGPRGCPWDREQGRESLKPFLIEESYELLEALDEDNPGKIKEELGDLLFQIVFHSQIAKEKGQFDIRDVINGIVEKMVRRHPHVFADREFKTSDDVHSWWQAHKMQEKGQASVTEGVPGALPSLLRALSLQKRVSAVGFDWERIEDIFIKLDEEIDELKSAIDQKDRRDIEDELGDIFFVLVRVSGFVGVNPESALRKTIDRFIRRFRHIEKRASEQGRKPGDMTLQEMEVLWEESKEMDV
jgi:tetrapyrrole methylase family protein/MazG family protein